MHVPVGETLRTVCPFCGGGRTKESSFVATNTGVQIKYICHRASCGKAGTWDSASGMSTSAPGIKVPKPWPHVFPATSSEMASLAAKYNLSVEDIQRLRPMRCTYSKGEIKEALKRFVDRFKVQGYYSTADRCKIAVEDLIANCEII